MDEIWKCNNCWAKNSLQDKKCKECGLSIEESLQRDISETRKKKIIFTLKTIVAVVAGVILIGGAGWFIWSWNKSSALDYQEGLEKDNVLDTRGAKTQCEVTSYSVQRYRASITCKFKVADKEYVGAGHPPPDYKHEIDNKKRENDRKIYLAGGTFVTVVYDPQNPSLNRIDGDRLTDDSRLFSPFDALIYFGIALAIGIAGSLIAAGGKYLLNKLKN
jgi:hypothetical protein